MAPPRVGPGLRRGARATGLVDEEPVSAFALGLRLGVGAEGADTPFLETCGFLAVSFQPSFEGEVFFPS